MTVFCVNVNKILIIQPVRDVGWLKLIVFTSDRSELHSFSRLSGLSVRRFWPSPVRLVKRILLDSKLSITIKREHKRTSFLSSTRAST